MVDPFIVDGEDESSVRESIRGYLNKIRSSSKASSSMENSIVNDDVSMRILPYPNNDAQRGSVLENDTVSYNRLYLSSFRSCLHSLPP